MPDTVNTLRVVQLQTKVTQAGRDLNAKPSTWIITHLGQDSALQVSAVPYMLFNILTHIESFFLLSLCNLAIL